MQDRIDLYTPIHKAYRAFMSDTLVRVGRIDVDDPADFEATLGQVAALLSSLRHHARHEDEHIHPLLAVDGDEPASAIEHTRQMRKVAAMEVLVAQVRRAQPADREALVRQLYRRLGGLVAHHFEHMLDEELDNNAALWARCTDAQLIAAHEALVASIEPRVFMEIMGWMLPALSPRELVQVMQGTRAGAPAPVFEALMAVAANSLPPGRYEKLRAALAHPAPASLAA
jgi:hypothetical protein